MSFYRNKGFWIRLAIFSPLLLIMANYGIKLMTSVYKKDLGNGVVIYADDYVKSGRWVFDCESPLDQWRPLPAPLAELDVVGKLTISNMYALSETDQVPAKEVIRAIAGIPDGYKELRYLYSGLDELSELRYHTLLSAGQTC